MKSYQDVAYWRVTFVRTIYRRNVRCTSYFETREEADQALRA